MSARPARSWSCRSWPAIPRTRLPSWPSVSLCSPIRSSCRIPDLFCTSCGTVGAAPIPCEVAGCNTSTWFTPRRLPYPLGVVCHWSLRCTTRPRCSSPRPTRGAGAAFTNLASRPAAARADAIVAPTAAAADEVAEHTSIARDRIRPIHHGVDHTFASDDAVRATRALHGLAGDPYVMWAGSMEPRKDVATLVDAFRRLSGANDLRHRLVLVGPAGWMAESDAPARRTAPLGDRVVFTGQVGPGELCALYRGADMFALPSRHEGFGLTVLEAMAQETAVLCSDLPVLREIAGAAATYVPVGDVDAWSDALELLLDDDARRAAVRNGGTFPRGRIYLGAQRRGTPRGVPQRRLDLVGPRTRGRPTPGGVAARCPRWCRGRVRGARADRQAR